MPLGSYCRKRSVTSMGTVEASVDGICSGDFAERVRINQSRLSSENCGAIGTGLWICL
jgi:hypothetical protein